MDYVSYWWKQARERIGQHWHVMLLSLILMWIFSYAYGKYGVTIDPATWLWTFNGSITAYFTLWMAMIINFLIWIWYVKMGLYAVENKKFGFGPMLSHSWKEIWKYFVVALITSVLVFIFSFAFNLIIAFFATIAISKTIVYVSVAILAILMLFVLFEFVQWWIFAYYAIIDKSESIYPHQAFWISLDASKGNVLNLIGLTLICSLAIIGSVFLLGIPLLWTIPMTQIAFAKAYKDLSENK